VPAEENITRRFNARRRGGDPTISHTSIDKSPRLHARAIGEVLAVVGGRRTASPVPTIPGAIDTRAPSHADGRKLTAPGEKGSAKLDGPTSTPDSPTKFGDDVINVTGETKPLANGSQSDGSGAATSSSPAAATPPALPRPGMAKPVAAPPPLNATQIPD
jgi:hypothetical protein